MIGDRLARLIPLLAASVYVINGTAGASTRGYDTAANPLAGLLIALGLLFTFVLFCFAYLLLDRLEQRRIDRMRRGPDVEGLIRSLRSPWLGQKAALALGAIGDERAIEPLVGMLGDRRDYFRRAAAEALGKIGDPRAIEPLADAANDRYASVRECARRALESIEKRTGQAPM